MLHRTTLLLYLFFQRWER